MTVSAYPLTWPDGWPRIASDERRYRHKFGSNLTLHSAVLGLYKELRNLGAGGVVVSTNFEPRLDGSPLANQRKITDPGVAVYFQYQDRPMVMAQDAYLEISSNVRSLALAINHLRGLHRHGGGYMMERAFQGFTALPPPKGRRCPTRSRGAKSLGRYLTGLGKRTFWSSPRRAIAACHA